MPKQWLVIPIAATFAASFFLPSIDDGTRGPHSAMGWVAALVALEHLGQMLADPLEEVQSILTDACPVVSLLRSMSLGTAFLANIWFLGASAWWVARARWQWGRRGGLGLAVVGLVLSANAWMLALPAFEFGDRLLFGYYLWAGSLSAQVVATGLQAWHDRQNNG
jgi:hypothetical protein